MSKVADIRTDKASASLAVTVEKGRLRFNGDLPMCWVLAIIAVVTAASGYPIISEVAMKLLRAK